MTNWSRPGRALSVESLEQRLQLSSVGLIEGTVKTQMTGMGVGGAVVFADTDNNGVLGPGEVSTITDSGGGYTLDIANVDPATPLRVDRELATVQAFPLQVNTPFLEYSVGGAPRDLVFFDRANDDVADFAVATDTETVLFQSDYIDDTANEGAVTFVQMAQFSAADRLAKGYMDGDLAEDVIVARGGPSGGTLSVITSPGSSATTLPQRWQEARDIAVSDLNGDSHSDVVVLTGSNRVFVYLGNGDGTLVNLPQALPVTLAPTEFNALATGDLVGDAREELIIAAADGVYVAGNESDGVNLVFGPLARVSGSSAATDVVVGEVSGSADIISIHGRDVTVASGFEIAKSGSVTAKTIRTITTDVAGNWLPENAVLVAVDVADIDADDHGATGGFDDIVVSWNIGTTTSGIGYVRNDLDFALEGRPDFVADVNSDHVLCDGGPECSALSLAVNELGVEADSAGDNAHRRGASIGLLSQANIAAVGFGEIGDAAQRADSGSGEVFGSYENVDFLLNSDRPEPFQRIDPIASGFRNEDVDLGDLNGDGHLDAFITGQRGDGANQAWLNDGVGNFSLAWEGPTGINSFYAALGDIDNDDDIDAVVAADDTVDVWLNDGTGDFGSAPLVSLDQTTTGRPLSAPGDSRVIAIDVGLADLDGDDRLDLYVARLSAGNMPAQDLVYLNRSDSSKFGFAPPMPAIDGASKSIEFGDIDNDGFIDAVVAQLGSSGGAPNRLLYGNGDGTFAPSVDFGNAHSQHVALGDINQDGFLDAVEASSVENLVGEGVRVWISEDDGNGRRVFVESQLLGDKPTRTSHVALADFDGDGFVDIFTANWFDEPNEVYFYDNTAGEYPQSPSLRLGSDTSSHIAVGDIDQDDDFDVIVASIGVNQPNRILLNVAPQNNEPTPAFSPYVTEKSAREDSGRLDVSITTTERDNVLSSYGGFTLGSYLGQPGRSISSHGEQNEQREERGRELPLQDSTGEQPGQPEHHWGAWFGYGRHGN